MYTLQRTPFCLGDSGDELGVYASKAQAVASLIVERRLCNKKIRWEFARNLRIQLPEPILTTLGAGDQTETEKAIVRWLATGTPSVEMVDFIYKKAIEGLPESADYTVSPLVLETPDSIVKKLTSYY